MQHPDVKSDMVRRLQQEILSLQGYGQGPPGAPPPMGLGALEAAFPRRTFPTGAVHEFISGKREDAAATNGFIAGLLGKLMAHRGPVIWVSTGRTLFPPALQAFGIAPEQVIFIDPARPQEALWAVEEALKCAALAAVVGELKELSFTESRRLQLAVEGSRVTGFIHRHQPRTENTVACVTRWRVKPLPSEPGDLPGVGAPRWLVQLEKVRNGRPGSWPVEWSDEGFRTIGNVPVLLPRTQKRKIG